MHATSQTLTRRLTRLLLVTLVLQTAFAIAPGAAPAAEECWKTLVNDYWADGRLDRTYRTSCYRDAIEKLPPDVQQYSDAQDDLRRALAGAIRDRYEGGDGGAVRNGSRVQAAPVDEEAPKGFFEQAIDKVGPKNADSIPVQVLVLASIALLLLGSAGASRLNAYVHARRLPGERTS
jgi:hypothetical protein